MKVIFSLKYIMSRSFRLLPVPYEEWQNQSLGGPRPHYWPQEKVAQILDIAEQCMRETVSELKLRARLLRKERAVGENYIAVPSAAQ